MESEKKVMLIVDDIEMNRAILQEYFKKEFEVLEAENGVEAYRILQEQFVDILVTDLNMPELDGFGLIKKIRSDIRYDLLKIIAITEKLQLNEEERQRLLGLGADEFIEKPFATELLCHRVRAAMADDKTKARIEQFKFCMDFSPIPFGLVKLVRDEDGKPEDVFYHYVNHAYANVLNIPVADIRGNTHYRLTKESGAVWLMLLEKVENNGREDNIIFYSESRQKYFFLNVYQDTAEYCIFFMIDVTEQKEAEKALREGEKNYSLDGVSVLTWQYDIKKKCIHQTGEPELIDNRVGDIENVPEVFLENGYIREKSIPEFKRMYRQVQSGVPQVSAEFWVRNRNRDGWLKKRVTYFVTKDQYGCPDKAYGTGMDITKRTLKELDYKEEEEYQKLVFPGMLAVSCINLTQGIVENIGYQDPNQKKEEGSYAKEYSERIQVCLQEVHFTDHDEDELCTDALLKAYQSGTSVIQKEYWAVWRKSKDVVWVQVEVRILQRPETGDVIAFFYNHDISLERLQNKVITKVAGMDYDYVSYINVRNKHFKIYFGEEGMYSIGEDYDANVRSHVRRKAVTDDDDVTIQAMSLSTILKALEKENVYTYEYDMMENDGSIRRKLMKYTYADREMGLVINTRTDIEEILWKEKDKQDKLERALEAAEHASYAKSEFLSRMSHDIRTPMNAIIGMTSIAKGECQDEKIKGYLNQIEGSSKFLLGLINDILDISKIESGKLVLKPEVTSFPSLLASIQTTVKPLMEGKKISFVMEHHLDYKYIVVDEVRFKQIFFNLLSNAAKYTPEGGHVSFKAEEYKQQGKKRYVRFLVKDDGIGMSQEFLQHAFEPFMQEQNDSQMQSQGTGLGLAIVKNLVELMEGKIFVDSVREHGSTFVVEIPVMISEKEDMGETQNQLAEIDRLKGKRVLLVEDNRINTLVARQLLESKGIQVEHAENGREAVEMVEKSEPHHYDLILMDIRMPVMNGLESAQTIRALEKEEARTIPIIAMTANAYDEDVEKSLNAGMNSHLTKPIEPNLFYRELLTWIK